MWMLRVLKLKAVINTLSYCLLDDECRMARQLQNIVVQHYNNSKQAQKYNVQTSGEKAVCSK